MTRDQAVAWLDRQPGTPADRETAIRRAMARGGQAAPARAAASPARVHAATRADVAAAGRTVVRLAAVRERAALAAARDRRMSR